MNILSRTLLVSLLLMSSGCATLQPHFESPKVSLTSFRMLPSTSMAPRFEIGLHVVNPNLIPLAIQGLSYSVKIEGHQMLTGVTSELPIIKAYGEGDVILQATADLFNGLRLLSELMTEPRDLFSYELEAKLDIGRMLPNLRVRETGEILLSQPHR